MKRPAFQFYPGDWQRDAALRACSIGARGLWIEMMCVMHQADPYGYLVLNGNSITPGQLARMVGATEKEATRWLDELLLAGVPSVDEQGLFSRRMVKDEALRNVRAEGGKGGAEHGAKGAEHGSKGGRPAATRGDIKPPLNPALPPPIEPPPSSSSSSSSSKESRTLSGKPDAVEVLKFLNIKANRNYRDVKANTEMIQARLAEGFTVAELKQVVAKKCREWINDDKMSEFIRPKTLFSRTNFANYAGELVDAAESS